ncbi:Pre-rRNA-processing protein TSR2-domain-containing protein [Syncephalastrum racemosum]|uniref:Pre-rRNA-processing protein TSR2-domain-containing protein n=1 Tax=Syncephalastrum racemosum TaxID=13706 RepID=A0A1X2HH32_SYNRA|nr:Pre-rRNA-processing protein TSR2-domain-containing protein [Syncephalastrum racemosum]
MSANKAAFEEGVSYIFRSWTALRLAVEQDWGGVESAAKRDWFMGVIVDYFGQHGKKVDIYEIEDILTQIMGDEFDTILEDDSPYMVAKHLVELYNQCVQGNYTEVERLREKFPSLQAAAASSSAQQDSSEDEYDDDDEEAANGDDMDMDKSTPGPSKREPEIDDDGFQTVRYK